jgi:hypothetical protein
MADNDEIAYPRLDELAQETSQVGLLQFEWPVDQEGHWIERMVGSGKTLAQTGSYDVVRRRGGPLKFYRPLEKNPGLWRQFAEFDASAQSAIRFADQFGLLTTGDWCGLPQFAELAEILLKLADLLDGNDRESAASIFTIAMRGRPTLTTGIRRLGETNRFDFVLSPLSLASALLLQAGQAITGNQQFRRCRACPTWFRLGGGTTVRREFCSDRCRVAWSRRQKRELGR